MPEAFSVLMTFDVLYRVNILSIIAERNMYPEQFPIERDDLRLEIVGPMLLGERRLQFHFGRRQK